MGTRRPAFRHSGLDPRRYKERDLSWLDWSSVRDMAPDGSIFTFSETGEGGGAAYSAYSAAWMAPPGASGRREIDVDLGGRRWALSISGISAKRGILLLPTGAGESRPVPAEDSRPERHMVPGGRKRSGDG